MRSVVETPAEQVRAPAAAPPLRILYVGCAGRSSKSTMTVAALRELGHAVTHVPSEALDHRGERVYFTDPLFRVLARLGHPPDRACVNERATAALEDGEVDVVWVAKSLALRADVLEEARRRHPKVALVFQSEDDMFARHNQSRAFRRALPLYDLVFTTKSYNAAPDELPALGARRVVVVDKGYDRRLHRPLAPTPSDRARFGGEVGFVGTFERERAESMLALALAGIEVRVFGSGWESWRDRHRLLVVEGRPLTGAEYALALANTDINLGYLRRQNRDLHTDRSVEIPACGAFLLAERTDEHRRLFREGEEAEYFGDQDELVSKIEYYRRHGDQRRAIAARGRQRCVRDGYSFHDRLVGMVDAVREVLA